MGGTGRGSSLRSDGRVPLRRNPCFTSTKYRRTDEWLTRSPGTTPTPTPLRPGTRACAPSGCTTGWPTCCRRHRPPLSTSGRGAAAMLRGCRPGATTWSPVEPSLPHADESRGSATPSRRSGGWRIRCPSFAAPSGPGLAFDVILLSAVWMHVAPSDRGRAFRKLVNLLKPGGLIALSLRHGPAEATRAMHTVSADEIRRLARDHGALVERCVTAEDHLGRPDVRWTQVALRLPDDGTGALPPAAARHPERRREELHLQAGAVARPVPHRGQRRRPRAPSRQRPCRGADGPRRPDLAPALQADHRG